jgi:hypothetical protein
LTPAELALVMRCRGDANRCGMALLLKTLPYLGYVPGSLSEIPPDVRAFVAGQLGLLWDHSDGYQWETSTRDYHIAQVRYHTGWRFPTIEDKDELERWLRAEGALQAHTADLLFGVACRRMRNLQIELPSERELRRIVSAALAGFFQDIHQRVTDAIGSDVRPRIDDLLMLPDDEIVSTFEELKSEVGKAGVRNFRAEIARLKIIRAIGLSPEPFSALPWKVLQALRRRAGNEKASEMREHPEVIRYGLMGCFLHVRGMEVTDDITRMAVNLIHRLDKGSEKQIQRELLADLQRVGGKLQILSRISEAVVECPDGTVREVIFTKVNEKVFHRLVAEFRASDPRLRLVQQAAMHQKFTRHYRQMLPDLLETLRFCSDSRFRPVVEALTMIQKYVHANEEYFPEEVPISGVVKRKWREKVIEDVGGETKVNRRYYELCVLSRLEKALKCKEIWVEGSYQFRNPNEDLPGDWSDEGCRTSHYQDLGKPLDAKSFVDSLRERMSTALQRFNQALPDLPHLRIYYPNKKQERGLWALSKLEALPEPQSLSLIKDKIDGRYGTLELLDVFVEADRLVDLTRFFTHSGTKEMRSREELRPLLLLNLFAEGTNTGIKRVAAANDRYSYEELLYVRRHYFSIEALRNANGALVNKLLALRNPDIWGEAPSSCASDGSRFESWRQNLMSEWRLRYKGYGIMVY